MKTGDKTNPVPSPNREGVQTNRDECSGVGNNCPSAQPFLEDFHQDGRYSRKVDDNECINVTYVEEKYSKRIVLADMFSVVNICINIVNMDSF